MITMTEIPAEPRLIETEGRFEFDRSALGELKIHTDLTILATHCAVGDRLDAGATLADVTSPEIIYLQHLFIGSANSRRFGPWDPLREEILSAESRLLHLKFPPELLLPLFRSGRPFPHWPIRSELCGIVSSIAAPGELIECPAPVARVAWQRAVHCTVAEADAPQIGTSASFGNRAMSFTAIVGIVKRVGGQANVRIDVFNDDADALLDARVEVRFWAVSAARRSISLDSGEVLEADWPYRLPPRGAERRRLLAKSATPAARAELDLMGPSRAQQPLSAVQPAQVNSPPTHASANGRMTIIADQAFRGCYGITAWPVVRAHPQLGDITSGTPAALLVPADAVARLGATFEVVVDAPIGLVPRPVKLGRTRDGQTEILEGLVDGELVVRHLEPLAASCQRINALLVGLWQNDLGWWEPGEP